MEARIKLVGFICIFTFSIVISYSLEKFVFIDRNESGWDFIIAVPIFLSITVCGYFLRNIRELALHAFFFTVALLIFVLTTMSFERKHGENEFAILFRNQASVIRFFTSFSIILIAMLLLLSFGMLLSYLYKRIFIRQKS
jgi:hypothetical protein